MPFSTERVVLAWVEDLEQGLDELSRTSRHHHRDELSKDLLQSAQGLLSLASTELRKLAGSDIVLIENDAGNIRSLDDVRQLCARLRQVFRSDESTD